MNDINEIYAPIYRETSKLPHVIIAIIIILTIGFMTFYIIKRFKNRTLKERSLEEIYSDCIEEITSLGTELKERHLYCFKDFLSQIFKDNFYAKTHEELIRHEKLNGIQIDQLLDIFDQKFYSGLKIDPTNETKVIGELVECITQIYNNESVKTHD